MASGPAKAPKPIPGPVENAPAPNSAPATFKPVDNPVPTVAVEVMVEAGTPKPPKVSIPKAAALAEFTVAVDAIVPELNNATEFCAACDKGAVTFGYISGLANWLVEGGGCAFNLASSLAASN